MEPNVEQAFEELENDKEYQYLSTCKLYNCDDLISKWIPQNMARWDSILTEAGLCGSVDMIKNAVKASYFVLALLGIFVAKAKTSRHVFTVGAGHEFIIDSLLHISDDPFDKQRPWYTILVDITGWSHIIFLIRLANQPITDFKDPRINITVKTDYNGKVNYTEIEPLHVVDIFKFDNFQKMLDTVRL